VEIIFGTLSIDVPDLTSILLPGKDWLLLSGFPDPNQAGHAATNFILNVRHLANNAPVAVTGTRNVIGTQPVIIMTDINAAGALMTHALTAVKGARVLSSSRKTQASRASSGDAKKKTSRKAAGKTGSTGGHT
jgi:hypothetical protein